MGGSANLMSSLQSDPRFQSLMQGQALGPNVVGQRSTQAGAPIGAPGSGGGYGAPPWLTNFMNFLSGAQGPGGQAQINSPGWYQNRGFNPGDPGNPYQHSAGWYQNRGLMPGQGPGGPGMGVPAGGPMPQYNDMGMGMGYGGPVNQGAVAQYQQMQPGGRGMGVPSQGSGAPPINPGGTSGAPPVYQGPPIPGGAGMQGIVPQPFNPLTYRGPAIPNVPLPNPLNPMMPMGQQDVRAPMNPIGGSAAQPLNKKDPFLAGGAS